MSLMITKATRRLKARLFCALSDFWAFLPRMAALLCFFLPSDGVQAQDRVMAAISTFSQTGPLVPSSWPADLRTNAGLYSSRSSVWDAESGRMVFGLTMTTNFPWQWPSGTSTKVVDSVSLLTMTGWDYLPPEADEVWIRVKVVSGRFHLSVGCINLAFAPSDTYTDIRVVDDSAGGWQTIRFSLQKYLVRNYRRNDFTKRLPYVTTARWIQENLMLYLFSPGYGELLVDGAQLVSSGLGRSYPQATPNLITPVATVADFETTNDLGLAFAFTTVGLDLSGPQPTNYTKTAVNTSGKIMVAGKSIQWYAPPRRAWVGESTNGTHSLEVRQTGYESYAFTGLRLPHPEGANALLLTVRADHNSTFTSLVLDFLAYAAPPDSREAFPWTNCQPPSAWMADTNLDFDLFLSEGNTLKESYALYHLRRRVPNHQWTQVLLPLDDFAGIYACNEGTNLLQTFQPLRSTNLLFMGFFSPYQQLKAETRLLVDDVSLVRVDLPADQLRSFWQNPAIPSAQLIALTNYLSYYGHFRQRDQALGPISLSVVGDSNNISVPVSGPRGQRYDIHASEDLLRWQPTATGYVDSAEGSFRASPKMAARFYKAVSD
jgi:hypothetical protein